MSLYRRTVTIAIHREGDPESQLYRLPAWLFKTLVVGAVVFVVLVAIAAALYTPMARLASRVPRLNRQIERLTEENTQVVQLATTLRELEARYAQIRTVLGAEIVPEPVTELEEETDRLVVVAPLDARAPGVAPPIRASSRRTVARRTGVPGRPVSTESSWTTTISCTCRGTGRTVEPVSNRAWRPIRGRHPSGTIRTY